MNLGKRIKIFRKQASITQEDLATKSNLSRSYIADLERNRYNPSIETLRTLAEALNISANDLITEEQETDNDADIRTLNRAIRDMSPEQRKKAIKILKATELI